MLVKNLIPEKLGVFEVNTSNQTNVNIRSINLDANANAIATPSVVSMIAAALASGANPSSDHTGGAKSRAMLASARDAVVALADGVFEDGVIFTSGCTEANNTVIHAVRALHATLLISAVEHPSLREPARFLRSEGYNVIELPVDTNGIVSLTHLHNHLNDVDGPIVLTVQTANSETGVIQPIAAIAGLVAARPDVLFHSDCAQSFGKIDTVLRAKGGPHVVSISGHKVHGPMGVGALLLVDGEDRVPPLMIGGDQERGRRAGTEPLALIAGLGAACSERVENRAEHVRRMRELRDRFERGVLDAVGSATVNCAASERLPNTSSICFHGVDGMAMVATLDANGVMSSQGSACSSMKPTPSHVLLALGLSEEDAFSTVRFSVSPLNTTAEIDASISIIAEAHRKLKVRL